MNINNKIFKNNIVPVLLFLNNIPNELTLFLKNNNKLSFLNPLLNFSENNPHKTILFTIITAIFLSNYLLNLSFLLVYIDCLISSFFIFKNVSFSKYPIRLASNIFILLFLFFNPFNFVLSLIVSIILYTKYNQIIKKLILYFIQNISFYIFTYIPILQKIYPEYKQLFNNT